MDPHLYQAVAQSKAGDGRIAQLYALAVAPGAPPALARRVHYGLLLVAALLLGSGLIFWIAANWQEQSRLFKLGLIEGALALSVLAACVWPRARIAALLCATLALGGLLAYVGQTYQTGADAWQLFAAWAALSLIWVGLARSDVLWAVWVAIVATGIAAWSGRLDMANILFVEARDVAPLLLRVGLWLALALVPALVSMLPFLRVQGGMGWWSHRLAVACALAVWTGMAVVQIFDNGSHGRGLVLLAVLLLLGLTLWASLTGPLQDFVPVCLVVLAGNVLVLTAVARLMWHGGDEDGLLVLALAALLCLGGSVRGLLVVQHRMHSGPQTGQEVV